MSRPNEEDLQKILSRKGYGVAGGIRGGISGTISAGSAASKAGGAGSLDDVEPDTGHESLGAKKLQVGYSGRPEIRITFYRHRLADHSRAISEKALVDGLQYAGLISGDSEKEIRLTDVVQEKIGTDEEERTEIHIIYPEVDYNNLWVKATQHLGR
jgi:hypothetical protein